MEAQERGFGSLGSGLVGGFGGVLMMAYLMFGSLASCGVAGMDRNDRLRVVGLGDDGCRASGSHRYCHVRDSAGTIVRGNRHGSDCHDCAYNPAEPEPRAGTHPVALLLLR